jgi:hypothetical protein
MTVIANLLLRDVRPKDRVHLLLWDTPNQFELDQITRYNNAQRISYRENLMQRINPGDNFLTLHHRVEEELAAIKSMCEQSAKTVVLLEGFDCLITYLNTQKGDHITLFWSSLENTRKLKCPMWITLPHKIVPKTWPEARLICIPSNNL